MVFDTTYDEVTLFTDDVDMDDVEGAILIIREWNWVWCTRYDGVFGFSGRDSSS